MRLLWWNTTSGSSTTTIVATAAATITIILLFVTLAIINIFTTASTVHSVTGSTANVGAATGCRRRRHGSGDGGRHTADAGADGSASAGTR